MDMAKLMTEDLAAFFPVYDGGNVTWVITRSGREFPVRRTCKTVLKNLARFYNVDLAATRDYYGRAVNKKQGVPIPMTAKLLLIPVKVRKKPLGENDGTLGYVNFREIKELRGAAGGCCRIILENDRELEVHLSPATMREYMKNARLVESIFLKRHFEGYKLEDANKYMAELPEQYNMLQEAEGLAENDEDPLREYLLKLFLELVQLIRRQKNQAAR